MYRVLRQMTLTSMAAFEALDVIFEVADSFLYDGMPLFFLMRLEPV